MSDTSYRYHPRNPANQPFQISGNSTRKNHWSKVRGHNNASKRERD